MRRDHQAAGSKPVYLVAPHDFIVAVTRCPVEEPEQIAHRIEQGSAKRMAVAHDDCAHQRGKRRARANTECQEARARL